MRRRSAAATSFSTRNTATTSAIRRTLEQIVRHYPGDRDTADFRALTLFLKRVWFANGIHHHYAHDKFVPGFSPDVFAAFVRQTPAEFPLREGQSLDELIAELTRVLFDAAVDAKLVSKSADRDVLTSSAVNFYSGLTQREVEAFYASLAAPGDTTPVSLGLNSRAREARRRARRRRAEGGRAVHAGHRTHGRLAREGRGQRRERCAARCAHEADRVLSQRQPRGLGRLQHRLAARHGVARRSDSRLHRGLSRSARYARHVRERRVVPRSGGDAPYRRDRRCGAVVRGSHAVLRAPQEAERHRNHGQGHHRRHRSGRRRPDDADRHQPAELRLDSPRARLQIGEPRERRRGLQRRARRSRPGVLLRLGRDRAQRALRRARGGLARRLARGHRPRLGPARARRRTVARDDEELRLDARGSACRSRGAVFRGRSEARRARPDAVRSRSAMLPTITTSATDCCSS